MHLQGLRSESTPPQNVCLSLRYFVTEVAELVITPAGFLINISIRCDIIIGYSFIQECVLQLQVLLLWDICILPESYIFYYLTPMLGHLDLFR